MSPVVSLREFKEWRESPTLVLVDLHGEKSADPSESDGIGLANALVNCRLALAHARARGFPVAFFRQVEQPSTFTECVRLPSWIAGFEPTRSDMVFDRQRPSCYASPEFVEMTNYTGGNCVIAGLFGESSCLATAIEAFHRNHRLTYLADASLSRGRHGVSPSAMHEAVTSIASQYGKVMPTRSWILMTDKAQATA